MLYQLRKRLPIWIGLAVRPILRRRKSAFGHGSPFAELHKLTLSSIPCLRRTGRKFSLSAQTSSTWPAVLRLLPIQSCEPVGQDSPRAPADSAPNRFC